MFELLITLCKGIQQLLFALMTGAICVNIINYGFTKYAFDRINFKITHEILYLDDKLLKFCST